MARTWTSASSKLAGKWASRSEREPPPPGGSKLRLPQGLRALAHPDYRIFWLSQLGSLTGTWMQGLAQSWLVLSMTNSPTALGLIGVCQFGPTLLLGIPAGVLVDRLPRRRLLRATQASYALVTGVLAVLVTTNQVELWQIYGAAAAFGVITAVDMPTRQAFVVDLVGTDDLMNAIALNSALFNTTRVLGPALAGVFLATFGPAVCFVVNALSYLPVVAGLTVMRTEGTPQRETEPTSPVEHLRQGVAYVRRTAAVRLPIVLVGLVAVFGMNFGVWVPLLARDTLEIGASGFGLMMSSLGIGSLGGSLTLAFAGRSPVRLVIVGAALLFGVMEVLLGFATGSGFPPALALVLMACIGFAMSVTMALANTTVQTGAPDRLRGRIMSIYMTVFAGSAPVGAAIAGFASDAWGAPVAVAAGGLVVALVALLIGGGIVAPRRTSVTGAGRG